MLDIRRLRYFKAIADCGSMAAAARALNVAQPSLSGHVAELERAYGVVLFRRQARGVALTAAGERLRAHAETVLAALAAAETELRQLGRAAAARDPVSLGLLPSWGPSLAPAIIAATARELPQVSLRIVELRHDEALLALRRGEIDLAVVLEDPAGGAALPLAREPLYHVSREAGTGPIAFAEVMRRRLVLPSAVNQLRKHLDAAAAALGGSLAPVMEIDGQDTIKSAIRAGVGGSVMTWNAIRDDCLAGLLVARPITDPGLTRDVYLGQARHVAPERHAAFLALLQAQTAALARGAAAEGA